jgi:hypothetical protein
MSNVATNETPATRKSDRKVIWVFRTDHVSKLRRDSSTWFSRESLGVRTFEASLETRTCWSLATLR